MLGRMIISLLPVCLLPSLSIAGSICTTKSGHLASADKEVVELAVKYAAKNDRSSFNNLIMSRQAFVLNGGLRVKVIERSKNLVQFGAVGYEVYNWAHINALACP